MKKIVSSFVLLFLALSLFSGLQFVGSVSANFLPAQVPDHSIEITEDGTVNGTDKIQRSGNIYTFTGDVEGSIVVSRSDIVIDGAGFTLQGNGDLNGVWLQERYNVEIKNLNIKNFRSGVTLTYGSTMDSSTNVTLSGNTITDSVCGIRFSMFLQGNSVLDNILANNTYGIYVSYSSNNVFRNNQMTQNKYNFWVNSELSSGMSEFINDVDASNTVDGKPIIYWINQHNKTVPSDAGYVVLINCTNITVQGLVLTNNSQGVLLIATNNSLITKNHVTNNDYGIVLFTPYEQCVGNTITENNITANSKDGINSWNSDGTIVTGNSITDNQENGINFFDSRGAVISENTMSGNKESNVKIWGSESDNNTVSDNNYPSQDDIPEFPQWTPLLIMSCFIVALMMFYRRSLQKQSQKESNP